MNYQKSNQPKSNYSLELALSKEREKFASIIINDLRVPVLATIRMLDLLLENAFGKLTAKQREMLILMAENERDLDRSLTGLVDSYRLLIEAANKKSK